MINRLKLYFTHYDFTDDYYISVLNEHKLNPYQEYDKNVHRIAMLECVLQIFTELARASNNNEFNSQIQYWFEMPNSSISFCWRVRKNTDF